MQDIQIKCKIKDVNKLLEELRKNRYILVSGDFEEVIRYDFENNELANKGIFIRTKNGIDQTITIKEKENDYKSNKYFQRKNKTLAIEDCNKMKYFLNKIGLTKMRKMEKYRIIWKKGNIEIHLDELPFGIFCEICASEKEIDKIINKYSINEFYNCTYWDIYYKISKKNIDDKNILFNPQHIFLANSLI